MFLVSLENEKCKIKITCRQIADMGAVSVPSTFTYDYGDVDEWISNSINYGTLETPTSIEGDTFVVVRKERGDATWTTLLSKTIADYDDLDFVYYDKYTRSRRIYDYEFRILDGTSTIYTYAISIKCSFDSIYISDEIDEYILDLNLSYDFDEGDETNFQKLLQSKYPRRIRNGLYDAKTGFVEGLPLPLDANGRYITEDTYKYKLDFVSFLKNGLFKYIKTYKGDVWYVAVNSGIKINQGETEGAETVHFTFTEMADAPIADAV